MLHAGIGKDKIILSTNLRELPLKTAALFFLRRGVRGYPLNFKFVKGYPFTMLAKEKKKIAEEVNLSFASMVIGRPITTFSKNQSNRFLFFRNFWANPNPLLFAK